MGLETVLGLRRSGVFIPYRHAAAIPTPPDAPGYPAVARLFARHEAAFARTLDRIEAAAPALAALGGPAPAPRLDQRWFPRLDAGAAWALIAERRPARIVEVGSGHSTRILAAAARAAGAETALLCIDPAPRAPLPDGVDHRRELLRAGHAPLFEALAPGDVAFFDSSHVLHPHTDVDLILTAILPALAPGVLVHVHDVTLPDPYPPEWGWRGYAEQSGVAPWMLSGAYAPLWSSWWAVTRMSAGERPAIAALPLLRGAFETSLWMERVAGPVISGADARPAGA